MINKDDKNLGEAYEQINEGILRRSDAKAGTRMAGLGAKALGGLGKVVPGQIGDAMTNQATQNQGKVDAQRLEQLMGMYVQDIQKLMQKMEQDVSKLGMDKEAMKNNPELLKANPKAMQLGYVYGGLKNAIKAGQSIQGETANPAQTGQVAPKAAPQAATPAPQAGTGTM